MAAIDKALPNEVRKSIEIEGPETAVEEKYRYSRTST
jgi:hypothetical protein